MGHYFTSQPQSTSQRRLVPFEFANIKRQVYTDNEVFAKQGLDRGTAILLKAMLEDMANTLANRSAEKPLLKFYDLAAGWGAISLVIGEFFPNLELYLSDINERAIALAKANLALWQQKAATCVVATDFAAFLEQEFDFISLNPPIRTGKEHVLKLLELCVQHLASQASFYCVIGKKQGAPSYAKYLTALAANYHCSYAVLSKEAGFYVFKLQRLI